MMTTRLPLALMGEDPERALLHQVGRLQVLEGQVDAVELPARHGQVPRQRGPAGQHDGVEGGPDVGRRPHRDVGRAGRADAALLAGLEDATATSAGRAGGSPPTDVEHTKVTPSASIWASRRSRTAFSILNSGMP